MTEALLIYLGIGSVLVAVSVFFMGLDGEQADLFRVLLGILVWPFIVANFLGKAAGAVFGGDE